MHFTMNLNQYLVCRQFATSTAVWRRCNKVLHYRTWCTLSIGIQNWDHNCFVCSVSTFLTSLELLFLQIFCGILLRKTTVRGDRLIRNKSTADPLEDLQLELQLN